MQNITVNPKLLFATALLIIASFSALVIANILWHQEIPATVNINPAWDWLLTNETTGNPITALDFGSLDPAQSKILTINCSYIGNVANGVYASWNFSSITGLSLQAQYRNFTETSWNALAQNTLIGRYMKNTGFQLRLNLTNIDTPYYGSEPIEWTINFNSHDEA